MSNLELLERLANGPRAERYRARLDGTDVELRVVKKPFARDVGGFLTRTKKLSDLDHPSLRMVRGATLLPDGRPAAVLSQVDWLTLSASPKQSLEELLEMSIELSEGLGVLHDAGLTIGVLDGDDIYPGQPPLLDASLTGLSTPGDTPEADVQMLARALLGAVSGGKEFVPLESLLQKVAVANTSARRFGDELRTLRGRLNARANDLSMHATIEVLEPNLTGEVLDHWKLERVLGEGAMARVYFASDVRDGSVAAVKVLKQEHLNEPEFIQRFVQEVGAAETIDHPHVVKMTARGDTSLGEGRRCVYCVMEVLTGRALSDALNGESFGVVRAARLVQQAARGLEAAHNAGIVHRDVKPENLFLIETDGPEQLKVLDFGVAKLLKPIDHVEKVATKAGVVVGTPEYMAPEQALGWATDHRADIYALGLVLYELLVGELPFRGETFGAVVVAMTRGEVPPLPAKTRMGERVPPGLNAIVQRALEKNADDRYQSAQALADALNPFADPKWSTERLPVVTREAVTQSVDAVTPVDETELERAVKRPRTPLFIALGVLLAMVVAAVVLYNS